MANWQILSRFVYPHDAHMAKGFLESEGIQVILKDELTTQVNNFYSNAIGGVKILVRDVDIERGIEVLKAGGFINTDSEDLANQIEIVELTRNTDINFCPFCKSKNIGRKKEPNILTIVVFFILGAFFPIFKKSYKCFDCNKAWKFQKKKIDQ
ncbi:MAG: DUF2007 domain-containing protein [Bacteroidales bacterium]|nr:DUF2007 domain-containing protein [Bacteroidales bacterium]